MKIKTIQLSESQSEYLTELLNKNIERLRSYTMHQGTSIKESVKLLKQIRKPAVEVCPECYNNKLEKKDGMIGCSRCNLQWGIDK